jgi:hypothetical protein
MLNRALKDKSISVNDYFTLYYTYSQQLKQTRGLNRPHNLKIMKRYMKFLDWLSGGLIFGLDYQVNAYKEAIEAQNKRIAGLHERLDANRRTIEDLKIVLPSTKRKRLR